MTATDTTSTQATAPDTYTAYWMGHSAGAKAPSTLRSKPEDLARMLTDADARRRVCETHMDADLPVSPGVEGYALADARMWYGLGWRAGFDMGALIVIGGSAACGKAYQKAAARQWEIELAGYMTQQRAAEAAEAAEAATVAAVLAGATEDR